jgi:hypothetical protein
MHKSAARDCTVYAIIWRRKQDGTVKQTRSLRYTAVLVRNKEQTHIGIPDQGKTKGSYHFKKTVTLLDHEC